jgi:predicted nucleic acid-binding protein
VIVVDANVLVPVWFRSERTPLCEALARKEPLWAAPRLWLSEFRNVVVEHVRRGRVSPETAEQIVEAAIALVGSRTFDVESSNVLRRAVSSGCTAYDCEYVVLAEELGVPLVTSDRKILRAFPRIAISLEDAVRA